MRSAWNVRVAGWMSCGLARTTRGDDVGELRGRVDRRLGARLDDGAGDWRAKTLLAEYEDDVGEIALAGGVHDVGGARPLAAHAHVERPVEPEREAALGLVELHRGDADVEHDAVDRSWPQLARDGVEIGEAIFDQRQPAAGVLDEIGAERDRRLVAVDADDLAVGGVEDRARIAAGAEGAVDIDAAVTDVEVIRTPARRARECGGLVRQRQQQSRRRPPSFPCS